MSAACLGCYAAGMHAPPLSVWMYTICNVVWSTIVCRETGLGLGLARPNSFFSFLCQGSLSLVRYGHASIYGI